MRNISNGSVLQEELFPARTLEERKEMFLSSLRGTSRKYKRYLGSPIRYAGGKSLAVGYVVENIPDYVDKIVSPFIGGGSIEVACAKELNLEVEAYDIFDILINYWNIQINKPTDLYNKLVKLKPTKDNYEVVKNKLFSHWKNVNKLNPMDLATYYYFNHNLSYGPGFLGWMSKIYEDERKYNQIIEKVKNFDVPNLSVKVGDFKDVILAHKNDFLYCDPPYYLEGDSKMFRGIYPQRNFPIHHNGFNHEDLRDLLHNHKGGFILSYNDCSAIRNFYKDFIILPVSWQYTMGQGETRIGFNRKNENRTHIKNSHELLIINTEKRKRIK